jgi:hypothetical protein
MLVVGCWLKVAVVCVPEISRCRPGGAAAHVLVLQLPLLALALFLLRVLSSGYSLAVYPVLDHFVCLSVLDACKFHYVGFYGLVPGYWLVVVGFSLVGRGAVRA